MKLKLLIKGYYLQNNMSSYTASEKKKPHRGLRKPAESIATHLPFSYSLLWAPIAEHKTMDWTVV